MIRIFRNNGMIRVNLEDSYYDIFSEHGLRMNFTDGTSIRIRPIDDICRIDLLMIGSANFHFTSYESLKIQDPKRYESTYSDMFEIAAEVRDYQSI